jgi:hypothetical protein
VPGQLQRCWWVYLADGVPPQARLRIHRCCTSAVICGGRAALLWGQGEIPSKGDMNQACCCNFSVHVGVCIVCVPSLCLACLCRSCGTFKSVVRCLIWNIACLPFEPCVQPLHYSTSMSPLFSQHICMSPVFSQLLSCMSPLLLCELPINSVCYSACSVCSAALS